MKNVSPISLPNVEPQGDERKPYELKLFVKTPDMELTLDDIEPLVPGMSKEDTVRYLRKRVRTWPRDATDQEEALYFQLGLVAMNGYRRQLFDEIVQIRLPGEGETISI